MKIPLIICLTLSGGLAHAGPGTNQVQLTPEFITQLSDEMRERHPALGAASARTNAAARAIDAVPIWEDPMLNIGGMAAERMMRAEDGDVIYGVDQKLPLFKKPQLEKKLMRAEYEASTAELDFRFQSLRSELAKVLYETGLAGEKVEIAQQDVAWLEAMVLTMEARYRAGQSTLNEVLQVQNELSKRVNDVRTYQLQLGQQHFLLNRILNRPPEAVWPELKLPEPAPPVLYSQKLVDLAMKFEPRLQVMRREIRQAQAGVDVARRKSWPDVFVGLEGRNYSGDGEFRQGMATVKLNLPWFNSGRYKQEVRKNEALKDAAELELADYALEVRQEIHALTVGIDAARREILLYRDQIIPRSETALASARSVWESGRGSFRDVLDARRMLLDARLMYVRAVAEQYELLSELVLCCGLGDLEAIFMVVPNLNETVTPPLKN